MSDDLRIAPLVPDSLALSQERTENGTGVTRHALQNESQKLETQGHMPECFAHYYFGTILNDCICDMLRACEQRVRIESQAWHYKQGYADGLRDAVEAVKLSCSADFELVERTEVITVIEALKEKP